MIRVIEVRSDGTSWSGGEELALRPREGVTRWIDVEAPTAEVMAALQREFDLHPLAIEDCLHVDQRPKLEDYPTHLFVVLHAFHCPEGDPAKIHTHELHCFLLDRVVITVHDEPIPCLRTVFERVSKEEQMLAKGPDFILYMVADAVVDAYFPVLDIFAESLEDLEDKVLTRHSREDLTQIFQLKKTLVQLRRTLSPARDVFTVLSKTQSKRIGEKAALYFRDVYDHLARIYEHIDNDRDLLGNVLDAYHSSMSNRTNEIMKRLTIMSAIFLPLGFIVGFFGQNFTRMPYGTWWLEYLMLLLVVTVPIGMVVWFRRLGWIGGD